jgi:hypothetical protein
MDEEAPTKRNETKQNKKQKEEEELLPIIIS